jgi:hypothetical protein
LRVVTQRENTSRKKDKTTSKYVGVSWNNEISLWVANIYVDGRKIYLGCFANEHYAHKAYEEYKSNLTE